jgi:cobalamin biosynthesis protein CobD/CbiB
VLKGIASVAVVVWWLAPITRYPGPVVFIVATIVLLGCFAGLSLLAHADDMYWWRKKRELKR